MKSTSTATSSAPFIPPELHGRRRPMPLSRADRSPIARWFAEVDRPLLAMILALMAIGLLSVAVASPVGAESLERKTGLSYPPLYYLWRQLFFAVTGLGFLLLFAMRSKVEIRKIAVICTGLGLVGLVLVLVPGLGSESGGSYRWLGSGALRVQPSEFLKPMYAVAVGWILSCRVEDARLPVFSLTALLTGLIALLLMLETDFGQTVLYVGAWVVLAFVAGLPMRLFGWLSGIAAAFAVVTYLTYETARRRIDAFLFGSGDQHQVDKAFDTLTGSGLIGSGPFTGTAKWDLPEAHTDYIFSVIGEEFGLIACAAILFLYVALIVRVIQRLREERDQFVILAGTGLVALFAGQVFINIAVNLHIAPSKGMTLPFISYGGSSVWALSIAMGLLLALTRRNPYRAPPVNLSAWDPR
jgi:cell division protein FtsW